MKLASLLREDLIIPELRGTNSSEVLEEMVDRLLAAVPAEAQRGTILGALREREAMGSTAVGRGIAFPHARVEGLGEVLVVLGISRGGVEFGAPDGQPVRIFILVLTSKTGSATYLRTLAALAKLFSYEWHSRKVISLESPAAIVDYIASTQILVKEHLSTRLLAVAVAGSPRKPGPR